LHDIAANRGSLLALNAATHHANIPVHACGRAKFNIATHDSKIATNIPLNLDIAA
jgi:hypothetical protein